MKFAFPVLLFTFLFSLLFSSAQITRPTVDLAFTITRIAEICHVQPRPVDKVFSKDFFSQMIHALDAEDLRKTNHKLTQELSQDNGILMGYQITSRMTLH